jgi:hypothetical protein
MSTSEEITFIIHGLFFRRITCREVIEFCNIYAVLSTVSVKHTRNNFGTCRSKRKFIRGVCGESQPMRVLLVPVFVMSDLRLTLAG